MSSLQIGHISRLVALAAAWSGLPSSTLLPMSSLGSAVLAGLTDVWELRDSELSLGDSKLVLRTWWARGCGERAGEPRWRPLPSTRPPPRDRPCVMIVDPGEAQAGTCGRWFLKSSGWARRCWELRRES